MNKEEIWLQLVERHDWDDDEHICKLRARGLRNLIYQAWEEGAKAAREAGQVRSNSPFPFSDLFPY